MFLSARDDIRSAWRTWRSHPSLAFVAIATLALGIGVNLAVFGLVEALVLRPLPAVPDAGRVLVTRRNPFSYPAFRAFSERQQVFESIASWQSLTTSLFAAGEAAAVEAVFVSGGYFPVVGVAALRGRVLAPGDVERAEAVAVISERCWRLRFAAAPDIVGRRATVNQEPVTVVGVAAAGFRGTELGTPADVFLPVTAFDRVRGAQGPRAWLPDPSSSWLRSIGRLRPGLQPGDARAEGDRLFHEVTAGWPASRGREAMLDLVPLVDAALPGSTRDGARRIMITLLAVAACVLLIACANVANLLLASGERRRVEWGVRLSLGVTRRRLAAQLLIETLLLTVAASTAALLVARWALGALSSVRLTANAPILLAGVIDLRVGAAAVGVAAITTLACGLAPAWHGARTDVSVLLGRPTVAGPDRRRSLLREGLIAAQAAVSALLVIGAIVFVTTLRNHQALPAGFRAQGVAMIRTNVGLAGYAPSTGPDFYRRLEERIRSLPGVVSVSRGLNEPLGATAYVRAIARPGDAEPRRVMNTVVSPGYFALLGVPILEGRGFDGDSPPGAVVVNETLARRLWPGERAVGRILEQRDRGSLVTSVVGVVRDSKYHTLQEEPTPFLYTHAADDYDPVQVLFARTAGHADGLIPGLRQAARDVDPRVPVLTLTTLDEHLATTLAQPRAAAGLVTALAVLAAALAAVGLHGVLSFIGSTRRRELAIRLALGARPWHVAVSVAGRAGLAVAAGLGLGLVSARWLEQLVASLLFAVSPTDPWVLALSGGLALGSACLSAVVPAVRAIRTPPALALRE